MMTPQSTPTRAPGSTKPAQTYGNQAPSLGADELARAAAREHDPLVRGLNPEQARAVIMDDKSAIILAGAGSGKTKVLTTRIAWLLREQRATPEQILAVTFTNKAAKEMKQRLGTMVTCSVKDMWIGTFHGLCHKMLRESALLAGLPQSFTIMDPDDQLAMVKRILKEEVTNVPEDVDAKKILNFITHHKEGGRRSGQVHVRDLEFDRFAVSCYGIYEALCNKEGVVDFSELMLRVSELMSTSREFVQKYAGRFSHIHVDEFQDTNLMQYEWLKVLKGADGVIFAVGDDDQSIYSFRGSKPENMGHFVSDVARGHIIRLEQNYRSTGSILAAANALIEKNSGRMGKNLWTAAGDGEKMTVMRFENDLDEADEVARTLKAQIAAGVDPSEMAILYRSNYQSRGYERSLMAHGVPYAIYGGTRFYERLEIKNVLAYMRLTINLADDGAFRRVVNVPPRQIGEASIEVISDLARLNEVPMLQAGAELLEGRLKEKVGAFVELLAGLFESVVSKTLPEFMVDVLERSGLLEHYSKKEEDKERAQNVQEMVTAAHRFCEESTMEDALARPAIDLIDDFLANASLESSSELGKDSESKLGKAKKVASVTLMTVHAAKGLEFNTVVLGGAEEGVFPVDRAIDEGNEDEERRLMYVLITRARKSLYVTHAETRMIYGQTMDLGPSRFLDEVPTALKNTIEFPSRRALGSHFGESEWGRPKWGEQHGEAASGRRQGARL